MGLAYCFRSTIQQKFPIVNPTGQETIGTEYLKNKEKVFMKIWGIK